MADLVIGDRSMPEPRSVLAVLKEQLNSGVLTEKSRRGEISAPEDIYPMIRSLGAVEETCGEYARAFQAVAKEARAFAEDDLAEAFGEQDGIPNNGVTVPDPDGTELKVSRQFANVWEADPEAIKSAVAYLVLREHPEEIVKLFDFDSTATEQEDADRREAILVELLMTAMQWFVDTGKYEPQVTKVKQFKQSIAADEEGGRVASTVSLKKTEHYKGIKIERVQPKEK